MFQDITATRPACRDAARQYQQLEMELDGAANSAACVAVIRRWDGYLREVDSWLGLTNLQFQQDTTNEEYKQEREYSDAIRPKLSELAVRIKRKILASPHLDGIASHFGETALQRWRAQVTTYVPAIEEYKVAELELEAEYTRLIASARIPFGDKTYRVSEIGRFGEDLDRNVRYEARKATWQWFADNCGTLDRIFDDLVQVRTTMAKTLGFDSFVGLAYQRMCRMDYDRDDVARFRTSILDHVVPLTVELRKQKARRLGLERLYEWDLPLHDLRANPRPLGGLEWILDRAQEMFDEMGNGLDSFFRWMRREHLLDLEAREGKAAGGFCLVLPKDGVPFIFANFNGTKRDVKTLTHELGHAFQGYQSRSQPLIDYLCPTSESCEIHAIGLEFLTRPYMEKFFGEDADRFRQMQLVEALSWLPYHAAGDHYQHLIYESPQASPAERHQMWREIEQLYLPDRDYGDLVHPAKGGRWQLQTHIYRNPFYFIDYALARTCALQLWKRSVEDFSKAMEAYVALCRRGGEAPFRNLVSSAGLTSPFEPGCLEEVVGQACQTIGI